ncbi:MAG: hypothetical protein MJ189_00900 [Coriobacteriales bacterium]|nr:hypothetical protein [Coriobacteriales bacterium]
MEKQSSNRYLLMNKDKPVALYEEKQAIGDNAYDLIEQYDDYFPYAFQTIEDWIDGRKIAKHRVAIEKLLRELGMNTRHDFVGMARCLSLTDTFWMKREEEDISWDNVSLYRNPFDEVIARIAFDGTGMYGRQNSPTSPEYATSGSFAKCWIREGDQISLLKRGTDGYANAGFEPYSEVLASQLLDASGIEHVPYTVVNYHGNIASKCPLFTDEGRGFVSAHRFFKGTFSIEDMLEFCAKSDSEETFREMLVMDSLMANVDRHSGNYGFLVDNNNGEILQMAPLFDHNMACLPYIMQIDNFDEYISRIGPKIGSDFDVVANQVLTSNIRSKLVSLKDFEYTNPGLGYPDWKIDILNRYTRQQLKNILGE